MYRSTTYLTFFWKFCKFWILEKVVQKAQFLIFWEYFFSKIRDSSLKELLILRHLVLFVCIWLLISIFGDFLNIYEFSTKNGMTCSLKSAYFEKFLRIFFFKFAEGRQIDERRGMPSFASIPVTPRTLFKKNRRGRIRPPPPQAVAG